MKLLGPLFLTAGLVAGGAEAARIDAVYIDKGLLGPRTAEAGALAPPFLESKLAALLTDALVKRRIPVIEAPLSPDPRLFTSNTLYLSLSYARIPEGTVGPKRYRGYALYVSQHDPRFEQSLACSWQIGNALRNAGEVPWSQRIGAAPISLDPSGIRENSSLTAPKIVEGPAVFLEAGVLVDDDEIKRLGENMVLGKFADAIAEGVESCRL